MKCVLNDPIDYNSTLVQVMAWYQRSAKVLSEPMMTQITDAFLHHQGTDPVIYFTDAYIKGLVQNCYNSIANALELPQSCTKT